MGRFAVLAVLGCRVTWEATQASLGRHTASLGSERAFSEWAAPPSSLGADQNRKEVVILSVAVAVLGGREESGARRVVEGPEAKKIAILQRAVTERSGASDL